MSTQLRKTDGSVTLEVVLTENPDGSIDQQNIRITSTRSVRKVKHPVPSFAPMSTAEKVQEIVNNLIATGYSMVEAGSSTFDTYSFIVELPATSEEHMKEVIDRLGSRIDVDPTNNVTSITGTEFWIGTMQPNIRITAALNVDSSKSGQMILLGHIVMARCLNAEASLFNAGGDAIDTKARITAANRAGDLSTDQLEVLYDCGVLRRPVKIDSGMHTGIYSASF